MRAVELFELLARTTWHTIIRANRNRITFGEDAITSINLNAIVSLNDHSIAVEDTRVDEANKGCDFELWIGSDGKGWSRYAVQAKKITVKSSRYEQLNHKVRGRSQLEILKEYAALTRAAPVYCFYNFAESASAWNCTLTEDFPQLGCMITPATIVEQALGIRGARQFRWMHIQPETIPWRCLITCRRDHQYKYNPRAPSRWSAPKEHYHKALPLELQLLRREQRAYQLIDPTQLRYGEGQKLFPRWTAIVDTGPSEPLEVGQDREPA